MKRSMFLSSYRSTFKNLFRSIIFWSALALLICVTIQRAMDATFGYGGIMDTDPRFVLTFETYEKLLNNICVVWIMLCSMPIFTVISVVVVLTRDYSDGFYEIEKASGVKPWQYLFGRLAALVTVNVVTVIVMAFFALHLYVFTRGGVAGMELQDYLSDSFVRMMRFLTFMSIPAILMYIGLTFALGTLLKSGLAAAGAGLGYVALSYLFAYPLRFRMPDVYHNYLSPNPYKLRHYLAFYDSQRFAEMIKMMDTSLDRAAIGLAVLLGVFVLGMTVAYFHIRRRQV